MSIDDMPIATRPRSILIVDDNVDGAESLSMLLELDGHTTFVCTDGQSAVELAAKERPEVVILDIGLPGMNGYEVLAAVRAQPWGKTMEFIALTGWAQEKDRVRALEAGFDHYAVKPADMQTLQAFLKRDA